MATAESTVVLLTGPEHIVEFEKLCIEKPDYLKEGCILIPLDAEVEYILEQKNISYVSGKAYRSADTDSVVLGEQWTSQIFESEQWSFFNYRGVNLGQVYFLTLQGYLTHLLYYVDSVANITKKHPNLQRLVVFPPTSSGPARGNVLVRHKIQSFITAVEIVAASRGIEVVNVPVPEVVTRANNPLVFQTKRKVFGAVLALLNGAVTALRPKQQIRIVASDYWKNLAPYVGKLPSVEIILIDRQEALKAGLLNIWKFRMRFVHLNAYQGKNTERASAGQRIEQEWKNLKEKHTLDTYVFRTVPLGEILTIVLGSIVKEVHAKLLKDIDDTHACLDRLKPDVVILRSTVSSQTHFVVLAQVAKNRGVPSIEMQHGLEYYGPGSVSLRHRAKYTGVYGPLTKRQYESLEDKSTTPVIIGSPRFDVYASVRERVEKKLKPEPLSILCVAPAVDPGGDSPDTYDTEDYYKAVAASVRDIPNVSVTIKFRPGPNRDVFVKKVLEEAFKDISYTIAQFERFDELYPKHDIVISCYSTALIEALQCGKPVIYLGLSNVQSMMGRHHFAEYEAAHAMQIATTVSELTDVIRLLTKKHEREILSDGARAFLKSEYLFDGHSRERAVAFIMKLVEEREKRV